MTEASRPHDSLAAPEREVIAVSELDSGARGGSLNAAESSAKNSETLGWPSPMVVRGYDKVQSDKLPKAESSYSIPLVRPRVMTTAPAKLGDGVTPQSRSHAVSSVSAVGSGLFLISHLPPKVDMKYDLGDMRREARPYTSESTTREQRRQASHRQVIIVVVTCYALCACFFFKVQFTL